MCACVCVSWLQSCFALEPEQTSLEHSGRFCSLLELIAMVAERVGGVGGGGAGAVYVRHAWHVSARQKPFARASELCVGVWVRACVCVHLNYEIVQKRCH